MKSPGITTTSHQGSRICGTFTRRALLAGAATTAAMGTVATVLRNRAASRTPVFLAKNQRYDGPLARTIADGLLATGLRPADIAGRSVLLKPNIVEPSPAAPHITTHPAVLLAAADVFRDWGARVIVGEAPGHLRDTELALLDSGLHEALALAKLEFADLNYEDSVWLNNQGRVSQLSGFYIPRVVAEADLVVSVPKLKTHHWIGMTAGLKNMYGVLPGIHYGWPKNVLHHAGIPQTVFDINASLPPVAVIVDGIVCMEGDGPIMGDRKPLGLIAVGTNVTAVDATCARIAGLAPERLDYLRLAADRLGPIDDALIDQRGEPWQDLVDPFAILDLPHLRRLRSESTIAPTHGVSAANHSGRRAMSSCRHDAQI